MLRVPTRVLAAALCALPCLSYAGDHVGPQACRPCHPAAYDAWLASPHARARESLPQPSRDDPRCLTCHAPAAAEGIAGVSCEACHGAGRLYSPSYVMRDPELARALGLVDPGEKTCLACHTETTPSLARFDHARKLPLIRHWDEGRSGPGDARKGR